jgi:hypothetical protein
VGPQVHRGGWAEGLAPVVTWGRARSGSLLLSTLESRY